MNKSETKQKELYETPVITDINPVSAVHVAGESIYDPEEKEYAI